MKTSSDRILTTHVGSLPRPLPLEEMLYAKEMGTLDSERAATLPDHVASAVSEIAKKQAEVGVSIIDDGEMSKYAYSTYSRNRLTGLTGANQTLALSELIEFPNFAKRINLDIQTPACIGPIEYRGEAELRIDIENFKSALAGVAHEDGFMNASSPGIMAHYMPNQFYPSHEAYLYALADAMKHEYDAIVASGLILQIDCPDLALGRHFRAEPMSVEEFRSEVAMLVEVLNHALRDIPADRVRMHLCWGNYESPHHHDIDLHEIFDLVIKARPMALLLEAANPRHAHEWSLFKETSLPEDKIIVPGVIDTCTNYIEHREVVAQRIQQYADLVGRERVIAGTDCGFASLATMKTVDPDIAWKKLEAMVQGAEIASSRLWRKAT